MELTNLEGKHAEETPVEQTAQQLYTRSETMGRLLKL